MVRPPAEARQSEPKMPDQKTKPPKRPTFTDREALLFHSQGRPGKLQITPTKPMACLLYTSDAADE